MYGIVLLAIGKEMAHDEDNDVVCLHSTIVLSHIYYLRAFSTYTFLRSKWGKVGRSAFLDNDNPRDFRSGDPFFYLIASNAPIYVYLYTSSTIIGSTISIVVPTLGQLNIRRPNSSP